MKIAIGNDHAGTEYKLAIIGLLKSMGIEVINHGTDGSDSVDYADFVHPVARAALCWTTEIVKLAKEHNDANILSLPARFISLPQALEMVKTFLNTSFEGGRHERRIEKIPCK